MTRRRYLYIEAAVAAVILGLLLVVMIPPFLKAQGRARTARAIHDLERIAKAMQAIEMESERIDIAFIVGSLNGGIWLSGLRSIEEWGDGGFKRTLSSIPPFNTRSLPLSRLGDHLDVIPIPIWTLSIPGMVNSPGRYEVSTQDGLQWPTSIPLIQEMMTNTVHLGQLKSHAHVGVSFGPYYDELSTLILASSGHTDIVRPPSIPSFLSLPRISYFVPYNPTNGVMSHGFIMRGFGKGPPLTLESQHLENELLDRRLVIQFQEEILIFRREQASRDDADSKQAKQKVNFPASVKEAAP